MSLVRETRLSDHGKERASHVQGAMKRQLGVLEGRSRSEKWSETCGKRIWARAGHSLVLSFGNISSPSCMGSPVLHTGCRNKHLALDFCCMSRSFMLRGVISFKTEGA